MFTVKTLAALFPPYPREIKTNTVKFTCDAILALAFATHSHAGSIVRAWLKHAHSFDHGVLAKSNFSNEVEFLQY